MAVVLTTLAVLVSLFVFSGAQAQNNTNKDFNYIIIGSDIGSSNDSLLYAQCVYEVPSNCTVSIKRVGSSNIQSCSFQLPNDNKGERSVLTGLRRFDDGKVVLSWSAYGADLSVLVSILNLSDCSLSHSFKYSFTFDDDKISTAKPVLNKNGFDVFIYDKTICGPVGKCRVSFDTEGRRIGDPVPFATDLFLAQAWTVAADSSAKGFFIAGYAHSNKFEAILRIKRVDPSGQVTDVITDRAGWTNERKLDSVSNAHGYFGMCWSGQYSDALRCVQFDDTNKIRLNVSSLTIPGNESFLKVYNLAGDGMLLITQIEPRSNIFVIRKIDATGLLGRSQEVRHDCPLLVYIFKLDIAETEDDLILYFPCFGYAWMGPQLINASVLRLKKKNFI